MRLADEGANKRSFPRVKLVIILFFFSSRRRHTRLQGDWSSDVCSSDLSSVISKGWPIPLYAAASFSSRLPNFSIAAWVFSVEILSVGQAQTFPIGMEPNRSEERRVGKECRSRWSPYH